jgi:thiamine kinase-like enzyme
MDLISGITLADRMRKLKYKHGLEDMIALQIKTYAYDDLELPTAYDAYKEQILNSNLDEEIKHKAIDTLLTIKPIKKLCHFDFHLENIMYDGQKYIIIDWVNAKLGNPLMDIARSYIIFKQYVKRLANKYLRLMTKEMNIDVTEVYRVLPLMAALRMLEHIDEAFNLELKTMIFQDYQGV